MNFGIRQEAFIDYRCSSLPLSDSNVNDGQAIGSPGDFSVKPGRTGSSCCSRAGERWRSLIQKVSRPQDTEPGTQQSSSEDKSTALKNRRVVRPAALQNLKSSSGIGETVSSLLCDHRALARPIRRGHIQWKLPGVQEHKPSLQVRSQNSSPTATAGETAMSGKA